MIKIQQQRGVVLVIALVFLSLMTIVGVTAMQGTTQEEKMSSNAAQRGVAFQVAEAGLREAEDYIRHHPKASYNNSTPGLRPVLPPPTTDLATHWMDEYAWEALSALGTNLSTNDNHSNQPRYVIERLALLLGSSKCFKAPCSKNKTNAGYMYRITARGTGGVTDAVVILQTIYNY